MIEKWIAQGAKVTKPEPETLELPAGVARKGDKVRLEVRAIDDQEPGAVATVDLVVSNTAPEAPVVAILPSSPRTGDALSAAIVKPARDADADAVKYEVRWKKDGADWGEPGALVVPAAATRKGEVWTLEVTPTDGERAGPALPAAMLVGPQTTLKERFGDACRIAGKGACQAQSGSGRFDQGNKQRGRERHRGKVGSRPAASQFDRAAIGVLDHPPRKAHCRGIPLQNKLPVCGAQRPQPLDRGSFRRLGRLCQPRRVSVAGVEHLRQDGQTRALRRRLPRQALGRGQVALEPKGRGGKLQDGSAHGVRPGQTAVSAPARAQPFTTATGRSRATFLAMPARVTTSMTRSTSL